MNKKRRILISVAVFSVIVLYIIVSCFVVPSIKYHRAEKFLAEGNYIKSASLFKQLGSFRDSARRFKAFKIVYKTKKETSYDGRVWTDQYIYDDKGNVILDEFTNQAYSYEYDFRGNIIKKEIKNLDTGDVRSEEYEYTYNEDGSIATKFKANILDFTRYTYDKKGNCIKEESGTGELKAEYKYDIKGRLVYERSVFEKRGETSDTIVRYSYDSYNNCVRKEFETPGLKGYFKYGYDENGICIKMRSGYHNDTDDKEIVEEYSDFEVYYIP